MRRPLHPSAVPSLVALAAAALLAGPAGAAITSSGVVGPGPAGGVVAGRLDIGGGATGQVQVDAGSQLAMQQLGLGGSLGSSGALVVTGTGSRVQVDGLNASNVGHFDIGGWGSGQVSVLDGASFVHGVNTTACLTNCFTYIGNAAGSSGSLLVSGAGASFTTLGTTFVANGSAFTTAADGFNHGTPGAATHGAVRVQAGATLNSGRMVVGTSGGGNGRTRTEASFASLVVEGAGTLMAMTRASTTTGDQSLLSIANGVNATASAEVRNGAKLTLNGSAAPTVFTGIDIGTAGPTSNGSLIVDGTGSLVELSSGQGFINVGVNAAGSVGQMSISHGGRVAGIGETGLAFTSVGRNGATGTLTVSGSDAAGNASTLRLAGRNSVSGGGAFLNIGGQFNSGQPGNGTANVLAGGRIEIDTSSLVTTNANGRPGAYVGVGQGASGSLTISGKSAVTGAASTLAITGGTGVTPFIGVGRDGATGSVTVSDGGRWLMSSSHVSTSTNNANGDLLQLIIGDRSIGADNPGNNASVGTVTVTGAGSEVALTREADRYFIVGNGAGGVGTLNVNQGGVARSMTMLVGNGAGSTGTVHVDGGRIELSGMANAGPTAGTGGGLAVGRVGTGTLNLGHGAVLLVSSTAERPGVLVDRTLSAPGGTGTIHVRSGSQMIVTGPSAVLLVGTASSATAPASAR